MYLLLYDFMIHERCYIYIYLSICLSVCSVCLFLYPLSPLPVFIDIQQLAEASNSETCTYCCNLSSADDSLG